MIKANNNTFLNVRTVLEQSLTRVIEYFLISFILFIAISTGVLMAGLYFEAKFSSIAFLILSSSIVIVFVMIFRVIKTIKTDKLRKTEVYILLGVVLVSLFGSVLSTSINRPDVDDSIYVPKAIFYADNPGAIIDKSVHWLVTPDEVPVSGLLQYYELSQAAFSSIFNLNYLDIYHIVVPGIVGFFICLTMFLLLRLFEEKQSTALLSIVFFILLILVLGETQRTYGNLSFARPFHGKFMFLTVGVPSWVYFSIRFFVIRDFLSWIVLLALGLGMAGVTASAMVFLPLLSIVIIVSYFFNEGRKSISINDIKLAIVYFISLTPLVLMALDFRSYAISQLNSGSSVNSAFPSDFYAQLKLLVNPHYPVTFIALSLAFLIVIFFSRYRRFFFAWVIILLVFLLNPFVSGFVIKNITTENIYWRLFYLLPFPLIICLAFSLLINSHRTTKALGFFILVLLIPFAFGGPTSILRPGNESTTIEFFSYKIGSDDLSASRDILRSTVPGSMMAPREISSQILILSSRYPQIHMRRDFLRLMLGSIGHVDEYNRRAGAYNYLYNESSLVKDKQSFLEITRSRIRPDYVVVRNSSSNLVEVRSTILKEKYKQSFVADKRYTIFQYQEDVKN